MKQEIKEKRRHKAPRSEQAAEHGASRGAPHSGESTSAQKRQKHPVKTLVYANMAAGALLLATVTVTLWALGLLESIVAFFW